MNAKIANYGSGMAKGNIQILRFGNLPGKRKKPFNIINCYISNGSEKKRQLAELLRVNNRVHNFVLGDFNFTEWKNDSPTHNSTRLIAGSEKEIWEEVKATST